MSEISDEEVDYGSFESIANPVTDSDRACRAEIDSQDYSFIKMYKVLNTFISSSILHKLFFSFLSSIWYHSSDNFASLTFLRIEVP
jgi:hypothetical protein